jgi:pimeloyl-ACP methyl ester carboxylesterase
MKRDTRCRVADQLRIDDPVLFGHSDGGSIALLHAGLTSRAVMR